MHSFLNSPQFLYSTHPLVFSLAENQRDELIFCVLRKKFFLATPEEVVRQSLLHHLHQKVGYPLGLFAIERGLKYDKLAKRTDLFLRNRDGLPFLLIECKAPSVPISKATVLQASNYNAQLRAPFVLITNGLQELILHINAANNSIDSLVAYPAFPA